MLCFRRLVLHLVTFVCVVNGIFGKPTNVQKTGSTEHAKTLINSFIDSLGSIGTSHDNSPNHADISHDATAKDLMAGIIGTITNQVSKISSTAHIDGISAMVNSVMSQVAHAGGSAPRNHIVDAPPKAGEVESGGKPTDTGFSGFSSVIQSALHSIATHSTESEGGATDTNYNVISSVIQSTLHSIAAHPNEVATIVQGAFPTRENGAPNPFEDVLETAMGDYLAKTIVSITPHILASVNTYATEQGTHSLLNGITGQLMQVVVNAAGSIPGHSYNKQTVNQTEGAKKQPTITTGVLTTQISTIMQSVVDDATTDMDAVLLEMQEKFNQLLDNTITGIIHNDTDDLEGSERSRRTRQTSDINIGSLVTSFKEYFSKQLKIYQTTIFQPAMQSIMSATEQIQSTTFKDAKEKISQVIDKHSQLMGDMFFKVANKVAENIDSFVEKYGQTVNDTDTFSRRTVPSFFSSGKLMEIPIVDKLQQIVENVGSTFQSNVETWMQGLANIMKTAMVTFSQITDVSDNTASNAPQKRMAGTLEEVSGHVLDAMLLGAIGEIIDIAGPFIATTLRTVMDSVDEVTSAVSQSMAQYGAPVNATIKGPQKRFTAVAGAVSGKVLNNLLAGAVQQMLEAVGPALVTTIQSVLDSLTDSTLAMAESMTDSMVKYSAQELDTVPDVVAEAMPPLPNSMTHNQIIL